MVRVLRSTTDGDFLQLPPPSLLSSTGKCNLQLIKSSQLFIQSEADLYDDNLTPSNHYRNAYTPKIAHYPQDDVSVAFQEFLKAFPEYRLTWTLDTLRRTDFRRLDEAGETYVDYMGGSLYPESLLNAHANFLSTSVLGNTHSISNSSRMSSDCVKKARAAVLSFFNAPPDCTVIFTPNATGALKLVGESFPFATGSSFVLEADSHNSVHGIREFAARRGSHVCYIPSTNCGGTDRWVAEEILLRNKPHSEGAAASLFALTGASNVTNSKNPLSILKYAKSLGYDTLLDAAALAPTSSISLTHTPVDAIAISFYKMFGFPTGVGALIAKKSFMEKLQRPWFAGGTVDIVQVPGTLVTMAPELHERFEDGTINYLNLAAVTDGLRFLSTYLPVLPLRLSCLMHFLINSLLQLRHDVSDAPVVRILSRQPTRRLKSIGEQSDVGSTVSLIFLTPSGKIVPNSFVEFVAAKQRISLRTGCMCNPGGAAAILGLGSEMQKLTDGITLKEFEEKVGHEVGVVRISLGLASSFQDVWRVRQFAVMMGQHEKRQSMWDSWRESLSSNSNTEQSINLVRSRM